MATCPRDGAQLDVDYGMATCPQCGIVLFVDMDGEAQLGQDAEVVDSFEDDDHVSDFAIRAEDISTEDIAGRPNMASAPEAVAFEESPITFDEPDLPVAAPPEVPIEPVPLSMEEYASGGALAGDPVTTPTYQGGSPGDPLDIQRYADSEISQAKDGPLLVRILISGIDSKEIRESLREAITDSRFGWDVDAVMSQIAKGELRIENVSPVKASVAINRIKRLPLRIRWEQYAVTEAQSL